MYRDESADSVAEYRTKGGELTLVRETRRSTVAGSFLRSVFLPAGFPGSVSRDYLEYQKWDTAQATCSTLAGLLSTTAVLKGVGVGDATATAASATAQFVVRDVTGKVGQIMFAWKRGSALDRDCKTWRLRADLLNDLAMLTELVAPALGASVGLFLVAVCLASCMRAVVGVAGGATRAALTQHQARQGNIAEVSAKDSNQETAVNVVGLLLGLVMLRFLAHDQGGAATWTTFLLLVAGHVYSNYRAVTSIVFETINDQRALIVARALADREGSSAPLTPSQVAACERVWVPPTVDVCVGVPLCSVASECLDLSSKEKHVVVVHRHSPRVRIIMIRGHSPADVVRAAIHGHIVAHLLARPASGRAEPTADILSKAAGLCPDPAALSCAGWDLSRHLITTCGHTVTVCE